MTIKKASGTLAAIAWAMTALLAAGLGLAGLVVGVTLREPEKIYCAAGLMIGRIVCAAAVLAAALVVLGVWPTGLVSLIGGFAAAIL